MSRGLYHDVIRRAVETALDLHAPTSLAGKDVFAGMGLGRSTGHYQS